MAGNESFEELTHRFKALESQLEEVKADKEHLEIIVSSLYTGLSLIKPDYTISWVNDTIRSIFPNGNPVGKICHRFYESSEHMCEPCPTFEAYKSGRIQKMEKYNPSKGKWYSIISQPIKDEAGQIVSVLEGITEITERKNYEQQILKEKNLLQQVMETSPVGITMVDEKGKISMANARAEEILGLERSDIYKRRYNDKEWQIKDVQGNEYPDDQLPFELVKKTGKPVFGIKHSLVWPDGKRKLLSINAIPLLDISENFNGMVSALVDITEQKKTEDLLREKSILLEHVTDNMSDMVSLSDLEGRFVFVGKSHERILGYASEELIGKSVLDFVHPDDRPEIAEKFEHFLRTGDIEIVQYRYRHKDNHYLWLDTIGKLLTDENQNPKEIIFSTRDITDRKRVADALQESEEKYRILFEHTGEALFVAQDGIIVFQNPRSLELTGYSTEEFQSKPFVDFIHEDDREMVMDRHLRRVRGENPPKRYAFRIIHKSGTILWVQLNAVVIQWDGKPATLNFMSDVTKRRQTEQSLAESETRYKALHNASFGGIAIHDHGVILECNQGLVEMTGYQYSELIGMDGLLLIAEKSRDAVMNNIRTGYEKPYEAFGLRKNGEEFPMQLEARNVPYKGKQVRTVEFRDITERKKAEDKHKKLQEQLSQAQKMESIGSLAGGIAHDFNNLLFPIVGLSEMMLNDFPPGSPEHNDAQQIFKAGKRGRELVQQILSFSRQSEQQLIPVHIQKVLKEVFNLCRASIPADIPITQDIQIDCRPVMADPTQIHQIAMNLITNAYHATEPVGGSILIQLTETDVNQANDSVGDLAPGRYAMLSVSDTGTGIDPAVISKIFDPYFTTKEKGRGTGLGLATVYGIVKAYGGEIKVSSDINKGSSFQIYLPVFEKAADDIPEKQQQTLPAGTEYILLVDDEQPIVDLEKQMLERLGYHITCFTGSEDALAAFRADPIRFDLVITDMNMPYLNGMQFAEKLVAVKPEIPIILCTGFSERINRKKAETLGIRGQLMKPMGMKDLAQKIREVLDE